MGTRVVPHPPHRYHFGLVFSEHPSHQHNWRRFWGALLMAAEAVNRGDGAERIKLYFGVDGHLDNDDYARLCGDVDQRRLAGVVFANAPHALASRGIVQQNHVPMVAITSGEGIGRVRPLRLSKASELREIARHLADAGCRRVAMVGYQHPSRDHEAAMIRRLAEVGVELPERWCLRCGLSLLEAAQDAARLLFSADPGERPDGLIVADDNFVVHAIDGILETGCRIPDDVRVVSLWNFPQPVPNTAPFHRIGPDAGVILQAGIALCRSRDNQSAQSDLHTIDPCHVDQPALREPTPCPDAPAHTESGLKHSV